MKLSHILNATFACSSNNNSPHFLINQLNATSNIHRTYSTEKEIVKRDDTNIENKTVMDVAKNDKEHEANANTKLSARDKLKKTIKDYGATVLIFHIAISITSLGIFYQLVSRLVKLVEI